MSFFGDIKDKFSKDTYDNGYMYEDDGANGQYGYDEAPETPDMPARTSPPSVAAAMTSWAAAARSS